MSDAHPLCPRCGYDLAGKVESWTDACPLESVCSECGLAVAWRDLFNEQFQRLPWFYEHTRSTPVRTLLKTGARVGRPWRFWREVRLEQILSRRRALVAAVFAFIIWHALGATVGFAARLAEVLYLISTGGRSSRDTLSEPIVRGLAPVLYVDQGWGGGLDLGADYLFLMATLNIILAPLTLLLMPITMFRRAIRFGHLVRVMIYALPQIPIVWMLSALASSGYVWLETSRGNWTHSDQASIPAMGVGAVWAWIYLAFAMGRYLRLPRAWRQSALLAFLAALASFTVMFITATMFW